MKWARVILEGLLAAGLGLGACARTDVDDLGVVYSVTPQAGAGGSIVPSTPQTVAQRGTASFTVAPSTGYAIDNVGGCAGTLADTTYLTGPITADCTVAASFSSLTPVLTWAPAAVKQFHFSWTDVPDATAYHVQEDPDAASGFTDVATVQPSAQSYDLSVFLPSRTNASYIVQACNAAGCTGSEPVVVSGNLAEAVGYLKASNTEAADAFGYAVALSADGAVLAVGASAEGSNATGIGGNQADNSATGAGAVYVFVRSSGGSWSQQAYVKASNTEAADAFGSAVALSADGAILAVGAYAEDSNATGVGGSQTDNSAASAGAVYIFARSGDSWSQQAYMKASNAGKGDFFGSSLALSADGATLAVGASAEGSNATGIGGNQADNSAASAGAAYVFVRSSGGTWSQQAYVKASNAGAGDFFGSSLALSADGATLAVGAAHEDGSAIGVDGQSDDAAGNAGAVYVFTRSAGSWSQQAYVKASNTQALDHFGYAVTLSDDGATLAVAADYERSNATGIDGNQADNSATGAGAVYVFVRSSSGSWSQQAYVKASNTEAGDSAFDYSVALSGDGATLAIGAAVEDSAAIGIDGDQADNSVSDAGAVYVFVRGSGGWSQQAYVKASNTGSDDHFGHAVALSRTGTTLAVAAYNEGSNAMGLDGDQANNSASGAGAVYLY